MKEVIKLKYKINLRFGGVAAVIQVILLVLRLTNIVYWPWYIIMAPVLLFLGIASILLIIFGVMIATNNHNRF